MNDKEREAFEAFALTPVAVLGQQYSETYDIRRADTGRYKCPLTRCAWEAWQARAQCQRYPERAYEILHSSMCALEYLAQSPAEHWAGGYDMRHQNILDGVRNALHHADRAIKEWAVDREARETRAGRDATVYVHADFKNEVDVLVTAGLSCLRPYLKEMHKSVEAGQVVVIQPDGEFAAMLRRVFGQV